jgi:hypothetical protein
MMEYFASKSLFLKDFDASLPLTPSFQKIRGEGGYPVAMVRTGSIPDKTDREHS